MQMIDLENVEAKIYCSELKMKFFMQLLNEYYSIFEAVFTNSISL